MKPFRGKRMGPQPPLWNSTFGPLVPSRSGSQDRAWRELAFEGAFFAGGSRDRFGVGQKPRGKVAPLRGSVIARGGVGPAPDRGTPAAAGALAPFARSTGRDCPQCLPTASGRGSGYPPRSLGSAAVRSAPYPTRLETRTKESNMCASHGALRNLKAQ